MFDGVMDGECRPSFLFYFLRDWVVSSQLSVMIGREIARRFAVNTSSNVLTQIF